MKAPSCPPVAFRVVTAELWKEGFGSKRLQIFTKRGLYEARHQTFRSSCISVVDVLDFPSLSRGVQDSPQWVSRNAVDHQFERKRRVHGKNCRTERRRYSDRL